MSDDKDSSAFDPPRHPMAPGCFGAPSVHSADSHVCQKCPAFDACGPAAMATLQEIRSVIDVSDLLRRHASARSAIASSGGVPGVPVRPLPGVARTTKMARAQFAISDDDMSVIIKLERKNTKTAAQASVLCKHNQIAQLRADLPLGVNPFAASAPSFMRVAIDLLLAHGGFTKARLNGALCEQLGWSATTAASHVAITCALLYAFGFITVQDDGAFVLAPAYQRTQS